jgi:hypothetical protein
MYRLHDADPRVRRAAVRDLGGRGGYAAVDEIRRMITGDPDARVREAAAHAAMRLGDRAALGPIRRGVLEWPDDESAGSMLASFARLSRPDDAEAARFVEDCERSSKAYLRIGAAMARVEWHQAQGMTRLLALFGEVPPECRALVIVRLRSYLVPAGQMVGVQLAAPEPLRAEHIERMRRWWAERGSDRLLADSMYFKRSGDADAHEIERLQGARRRIARMLGFSDAGPGPAPYGGRTEKE